MNGPQPYFVDEDGKSYLVTKDNWKFKGVPFHALIEWNFCGCKKTLILNSDEISFYGPNEKTIYITCDALYESGYLIYQSLNDIIDDLKLVGADELVLKVKKVQDDLSNGVYDDELKKIEEYYQRDKLIYQGLSGWSGIK